MARKRHTEARIISRIPMSAYCKKMYRQSAEANKAWLIPCELSGGHGWCILSSQRVVRVKHRWLPRAKNTRVSLNRISGFRRWRILTHIEHRETSLDHRCCLAVARTPPVWIVLDITVTNKRAAWIIGNNLINAKLCPLALKPCYTCIVSFRIHLRYNITFKYRYVIFSVSAG